ncbi:hypothetical protein J6590_098243, partial [Homalodisca vitripennis]
MSTHFSLSETLGDNSKSQISPKSSLGTLLACPSQSSHFLCERHKHNPSRVHASLPAALYLLLKSLIHELLHSTREFSGNHEDYVTVGVDEHRKARLKQRLELDGGTPGAGRPKNLRRKTKDDEDSFASYFDGVDPNVVEEDESTSRPEITTMALIEIDPAEFMPRKYNRTYPRGIRHTPSTLPPE